MTRKTLPDRRPCETITVHWNGQAFPVSIGLRWPEAREDEDGNVVPYEITAEDLVATMQPGEVFADVSKGADLQWVIADTCVIISLALQHGIAPADLAKSLGRVPVFTSKADATGPASPIGAVVEAIMQEAG